MFDIFLYIFLLIIRGVFFISESTLVIATEAEAYLKRDWMNPRGVPDKGAKYNGHVEAILKIHLTHAQNSGAVIGKYVRNEMHELLTGKSCGEQSPRDRRPQLVKRCCV